MNAGHESALVNTNTEPHNEKAITVAQEFSKIMIVELLKASQNTGNSITESHSQELFNNEMASTIAQSENFELTNAIYKQLMQTNGNN